MLNKAFTTSCLLTLTLLSSGCSTLTAEDVVSPSEVTIPSALKTVGEGLAVFKKELDEQGIVTGLYVDEVTLTLNLTHLKEDTTTLGVDLTKTLTAGSQVFNLANTAVSKGDRNSTLVLTLKNKTTASQYEPGRAPGMTPYHPTPMPSMND